MTRGILFYWLLDSLPLHTAEEMSGNNRTYFRDLDNLTQQHDQRSSFANSALHQHFLFLSFQSGLVLIFTNLFSKYGLYPTCTLVWAERPESLWPLCSTSNPFSMSNRASCETLFLGLIVPTLCGHSDLLIKQSFKDKDPNYHKISPSWPQISMSLYWV